MTSGGIGPVMNAIDSTLDFWVAECVEENVAMYSKSWKIRYMLAIEVVFPWQELKLLQSDRLEDGA